MKKKIKFLLIDDDHVFNFLHLKYIEKIDNEHEVISFESPLRAFLYLNSLDVNSLPDIIFLDINMPEQDGFEFLDQLIKERQEIIDKLNVFIVTSSLNPVEFEKSKKYEVIKGYYNKPINIEKLNTTINWFYDKK
jgi:response regulator of citrate/malate metabolism